MGWWVRRGRAEKRLGEEGGGGGRERREQVTKVTHTVARRFACGGPEPEPEPEPKPDEAEAASAAGRVRGVASCRVRFPEVKTGAGVGSLSMAGMNWLSCRVQS